MSYCRNDGENSNVFLYQDNSLDRICMGCLLLGDAGPSVLLHTAEQAIDHLKLHREAGHKVPEGAFVTLRKERKTELAEIKRLHNKLLAAGRRYKQKQNKRMKDYQQ